MRDRFWWLGVLMTLALTGQLFAVDYHEIAPRQPVEGTVRFDLYHGYLMVARGSAGTLKGLTFLLDTGASSSVLDPEIARRLHLQRLPASIAVLGGSVPAERSVAPSLNLGPTQRNNVPVFENISFLQKALPVRVDGIIGLDVLGQSAFVIDYPARRIHFGAIPALPMPSLCIWQVAWRSWMQKSMIFPHICCWIPGRLALPFCQKYAGDGLGLENQRGSAIVRYHRRV